MSIPRTALAALLSVAPLVHAEGPCAPTPLSAGPYGTVTVGGVTQSSRISDSVVDANGVALVLCLVGSGTPDGTAANPCLYSPVEPGNALSAALGRGLEAFWFLADNGFATAGPAAVEARVVMAVQSSFTSPSVIDGFQSQFQRLRIRADVNATGNYTLEHPWGSRTYRVDSLQPGTGLSKGEISETFDLPLPPGASPGLVTPVLRWDPAANPAPPPGYLGDGATPHAVVGSPCGANHVRITAVALDGITPIAIDPTDADGDGKTNSYTSRLFTVMGRLALTPLSVTRAGGGQGTVTSAPAGISCGTTCSAGFAKGTVVTLTASAAAGSVFTGWSAACTPTGELTCTTTLSASTEVTANFVPQAAAPTLAAMPASLDFGGQSMGTTSPPRSVRLTNAGTGVLAISGASIDSTQFAVAHDCASLPTGQSCQASVRFSPAAAPGELLASVPVGATLSVASNATASPSAIALAGVAEKSLVSHYYRAILRRDPDTGGKAFWGSEAQRMQALGVSVNEAWFALAGTFYGSAEYASLARNDEGFVTDLYTTFFNRQPDPGGQAYWAGQLAAGLPRDVALVSFMFSPEFSAFTRAIFGPAEVRKEIDVVLDFYRGILGRLPDSAGFAYWLSQLRAAQCQGASAVVAGAEAISSAFTSSPEYLSRARSNAGYTSDLYNAFLRRGGDLTGVRFWIDQIGTGARSRENVRRAFVASPEFSARVASVIAEGCLP